jgi:hypothetical protein
VAREGRSADPASLFFLHQLAVALWWLGRHGEAVDAFGAIEGLAPDRGSAAYSEAKLDQASVLLALGRWREGWAAYRWRASRASWRAYVPGLADDPAALGEGARRILVIGEQGLGDEVFFLRFASRLRAAGHRLIGRYDRRLLGLLQRAGGGLFERLLALDDPQAVEADVTLLAGDLPIAHGGGDVPAPFPLQADAARRAALEARLRAFGPPPYVGVTWRAGALPEERTVPGALYLTKEVPLDALGRLLRPLHASVVIVQRRPFDGECHAFRAALGRDALDLSAVNDDLEDALAALSLLDEYVGVSNTNTHLRAGCARRPARVLVYAVPEWRWGVRGDRSPWFPDARVYRASPDGSWAAALESLGTDLSQAIVASQHAVG